MPLRTRQPTGLAPWPFVLIEGAEKTGKSWGPTMLTTDPRIGDTYWLDLGEGSADQYAAIPGTRYMVIEHDGTYSSIRDQICCLVREIPPFDEHGRPNAFVMDSSTNLWTMIKRNLQATANDRRARAAQKYNKAIPDEDAPISMDLWNVGAEQWKFLVDTLKQWPGLVIFTARGKETAALDDAGKPIKGEKLYTIEAHKTLAFDADVIVRTTAPGQAEYRGARSIYTDIVQVGRTIPNYDTNGLAGLFFDILKLGGEQMGSRDFVLTKLQTAAAAADPLSPGQIQDIKDIAEALRFTEQNIIEGLVAYAGVNSWEALTGSGAQAVLAKLQAAKDVRDAAHAEAPAVSDDFTEDETATETTEEAAK